MDITQRDLVAEYEEHVMHLKQEVGECQGHLCSQPEGSWCVCDHPYMMWSKCFSSQQNTNLIILVAKTTFKNPSPTPWRVLLEIKLLLTFILRLVIISIFQVCHLYIWFEGDIVRKNKKPVIPWVKKLRSHSNNENINPENYHKCISWEFLISWKLPQSHPGRKACTTLLTVILPLLTGGQFLGSVNCCS